MVFLLSLPIMVCVLRWYAWTNTVVIQLGLFCLFQADKFPVSCHTQNLLMFPYHNIPGLLISFHNLWPYRMVPSIWSLDDCLLSVWLLLFSSFILLLGVAKTQQLEHMHEWQEMAEMQPEWIHLSEWIFTQGVLCSARWSTTSSCDSVHQPTVNGLRLGLDFFTYHPDCTSQPLNNAYRYSHMAHVGLLKINPKKLNNLLFTDPFLICLSFHQGICNLWSSRFVLWIVCSGTVR